MPKPTPRRAIRHFQTRPQGRVSALREVSRGGLVIYAILCRDGLIKIGCTSNLATRARDIGGEVLAFRYGDFAAETEVHRSLAGHTAHGREYYLPTPGVLKVVNTMRANLGLDPFIPERWSA